MAAAARAGAAGGAEALAFAHRVYNAEDADGLRFAAEVYRARHLLLPVGDESSEGSKFALDEAHPLRRAQRDFAAAMADARAARSDTDVDHGKMLSLAEELWQQWAHKFPEETNEHSDSEANLVLSSLDRLALPPLYPSDQVRELLKNALVGIHRRNAGQTGNLVLHGCVGVGKTTLLKASFILHVLAFPNDTCAFWDYEASMASDAAGDDDRLGEVMPSPDRVILDVAVWRRAGELGKKLTLEAGPAPGIRSVLRVVHYQQVAMYADEINELYFEKDDARRRARGKFVVQALNFAGKTPRCWILATGSSTSLLERVFPKRGGRWAGYHSFNNSVFTAHTVLPIRVVSELQAYVFSRYGKRVSEPHAARLLASTGGVGRHVHDILYRGAGGGRRWAPSAQVAEGTVVPSIRGLDVDVHGGGASKP